MLSKFIPMLENSFAQKLLFEGCRELNYDKVLRSIQLGANVNLKAPIQDHNKKTPNQHSNDIFIFDRNGCYFSPLSLVAMRGNTKNENLLDLDKKSCEIANLLLENGADIDAFDTGDMGNTPLHWSLVTFKKNLSKLFILHAIRHDKNVINLPNRPARWDMGSNPPLILALKSCSQSLLEAKYDTEIAELLISAGADVNASDHFQQSALHWAAILRCRQNFIELLCEKQACIQTNIFGKAPLELYNTNLDEELIKFTGKKSSFSELGFHLLARRMQLRQAIEFRNSIYEKGTCTLLKKMEVHVNVERKWVNWSLFLFNSKNTNYKENKKRMCEQKKNENPNCLKIFNCCF